MKKVLLLSLLMLATAFSTTWAQPSLNGLKRVTGIDQIKEGGYYYIINDRMHINGSVTSTPIAMSSFHSLFANGANWESNDKRFVRWGPFNFSVPAFIWKAEKVGDQWAFQNIVIKQYLGHKHLTVNPSTNEEEMVFSNTPVGYTLTKLPTHDGSYGFSFTNSEYTTPLNPFRYSERTDLTISDYNGETDANATSPEIYGYPGRWHIYEALPSALLFYQTEGVTELEENGVYYIFSDMNPTDCGQKTGNSKALCFLQDGTINYYRWGETYVYWGDFRPEYDGYAWVTEKDGDKWAFRNTKNNKYIGSEGEPRFSSTPVYFTLEERSTGHFFVKLANGSSGLNLQSYGYYNSCIKLSSDEGNNTRWHFIKVADYIDQVQDANNGLNVTVKIDACQNGINIINGNNICSNLVIYDGASLGLDNSFTATNATYTREMANEWGTICLPYEVESNAEVEYYTISGIENDVLQVTKLNTLPAGTPALVRRVSGTSITATASDVSVLTAPGAGTSSAVEMCGTFAQGVEVTDANAYYIKNNKFWQCNNKFYCDAFRAYFKITGSSSPSFSININDDDVTGVSSATDDKDATVMAIYSADGTKRSTLQQGINIVKLSNGKVQKIVVR